MIVTLKILFYISAFVIFWAMIGYPLSVRILGKLYKKRQITRNYSNQPSVTIMVVAHNEEKVILDKLNNIVQIEYPKDKIEYVIVSDNSTDGTNEIVRDFIKSYPKMNVRLFEVEKRMGKTNAQNEAHKTITTEFTVMTDANSMLDKNSVIELMAAFTSKNISYVTGRLTFSNNLRTDVSNSEASYWDSDLTTREIESNIQTITAGNGALYACRTKEYYDFNPIFSHDSSMPLYYGLKGKRAIANHRAIAYEKAGEVIEDEFKRKVRMNRVILKHILPDIRLLNIFKYKWFSYFYFGHRTCRYLLWIAHLLLFIASGILMKHHWIYATAFIGQLLFYTLALLKVFSKSNNKLLCLIYYYCVTIVAQWVGVYNVLTGKTKPFWEKAESTR